MSDFNQLSQSKLAKLNAGAFGFKRLATGTHVAGAGDHTDVLAFVSATAVNAAATYGNACVAVDGDVPDAADSIPEGVTHEFNFTTLDLDSGAVFARFIPDASG